jgi:uncharacterized protein
MLTPFQQLKQFIFCKLENELPAHLTYHNIKHTEDVMQAAVAIANQEGINAHDTHLLLTAALLHDTGFLKLRDGHEAESCNIARKYLPGYEYLPEDVEQVCHLIMATRVPQSPQDPLQQILCDADLDYLGRDDFFTLSDRLFVELNAECIIKNKNEWNLEQVDFMARHYYFTATSVNLRQAKKEQFISFVKAKISTPISDDDPKAKDFS